MQVAGDYNNRRHRRSLLRGRYHYHANNNNSYRDNLQLSLLMGTVMLLFQHQMIQVKCFSPIIVTYTQPRFERVRQPQQQQRLRRLRPVGCNDVVSMLIPQTRTRSTKNTGTVGERFLSNQALNHLESDDTDDLSSSLNFVKKERRVRYAGKYPRDYSLRYKELQGDADTLTKVRAKGMTPAGTHVPIMYQECMQYMGLTEDDHNNVHDDDDDDDDEESVTFANPNLVIVDCTLGYGGHSSHILSWLMRTQNKRQSSHGETRSRECEYEYDWLIGLDQDGDEIRKTEQRLKQQMMEDAQRSSSSSGEENSIPPEPPVMDTVRFTAVQENFSNLAKYLESQNLMGQVNGLLADLGVSSMQIDNDERGFTYKRDGPLDMRMNRMQQNKETAYELLCRLKPNEFKRILQENSDEVYAKEIANGILGRKYKSDKMVMLQVDGENHAPSIPKTTLELANAIRSIVHPLIESKSDDNHDSSRRHGMKKGEKIIHKKKKAERIKKEVDSTIARTMQALRIEVNGEFQALETLLESLPHILAPGGKAVFLTFHSGEDRRVKKSFKDGFKKGIYSSWSRDVVRPSFQEMRDNPRSTCCKLRWAVRSDDMHPNKH